MCKDEFETSVNVINEYYYIYPYVSTLHEDL